MDNENLKTDLQNLKYRNIEEIKVAVQTEHNLAVECKKELDQLRTTRVKNLQD